jgi:NitT/TauT family transport system substrate-binding protein
VSALTVLLLWAQETDARTRVVIGIGSPSASAVPLWTAADEGYFGKYGIDADLQMIRGGTVTTAALLSGQVKLASVGVTQVVGPATRGADLVMVLSLVDRMPYMLVVGPRIGAPADLRGKRIGVTTLSGASHLASHIALRQLGLEPRRDGITFLSIGPEIEGVAALMAGSIDAAMLAPHGVARMSRPPYRVLLDLRAAGGSWLHTGIATTRAFLRSSPTLAEGALRAIVEGVAFVLDPGNGSAVRKVIGKHMRLAEGEVLETAYREALTELSWKPIPPLAGTASVLRALAELGTITGVERLGPLDIIDPGPMLRLDREGWLDRLRPPN